MPSVIQIFSVPPGEAPLWVRQKWVGLELPIATKSGAPVKAGVFGVLSGPRNPFARFFALLTGQAQRTTGFIVDPRAAVAILEKTSPEAAAWWRQNAAHMLRPGKYFLFPDSVAEAVTREAAS